MKILRRATKRRLQQEKSESLPPSPAWSPRRPGEIGLIFCLTNFLCPSCLYFSIFASYTTLSHSTFVPSFFRDDEEEEEEEAGDDGEEDEEEADGNDEEVDEEAEAEAAEG
ncbi:hypothetical protein IE53DRAFT_391248 [Violaceomyces palustris]|uniref:Uncharacterized protein n=1 Tax=Violaceomyces palustris TaxID=1673888 RepID=A0ACD0NL88_9BASI|nr:hypothetical protein IE53DRAFT_391248 [Violaceomyces palustris]